MPKRRIKIKSVIIAILILIVLVVLGCFCFYKMNLKSVSKNSEEIIFIVPSGSTYQGLTSSLKDSGLIRSSLVYKIYIKLNKPTNLQAGTYTLNKNMDVEDIIALLKKGSTSNPEAIRITFREGLSIVQIADLIEKNTNHKKEDVLKAVKDKTFIDKVKGKYWFLTGISNSKLYYELEGYLYPNTYEFMNKDVPISDIFTSMLDEADKVLTKYKTEITNSKYSLHEIVTLASMIQSEGNNVADFKKMASVFINRLNNNMRLQSCASAYYGDKKIMGKDAFGDAYLKNNNYNTYQIDGLPIGPISNPGEEAIKSVLNPDKTDYLFFASDKNMKVYFSKTLAEHNKVVSELKAAGNWYGS